MKVNLFIEQFDKYGRHTAHNGESISSNTDTIDIPDNVTSKELAEIILTAWENPKCIWGFLAYSINISGLGFHEIRIHFREDEKKGLAEIIVELSNTVIERFYGNLKEEVVEKFEKLFATDTPN